jgi:hypothetical protein
MIKFYWISKVGWPETARFAIVLLSLLTALVERVHALDSNEGQAFAPLAMIHVRVSQQDQQNLMHVVESFAEAHSFRIGGEIPASGLPLFGRRVERHEIDIIGRPNERNTFFLIENFHDEEIFELVAYSHESKEVWLAPWSELISLITAKFGEANVKLVDLSPRQNQPDKPNHQNHVRQAFSAPAPAAFMKIHMQKGTRDDVLGVIQGFASLHHFDTEKIDFPMDGRMATFRKIVIDAGSFFVVDASSENPEVDVYGFSQEPENVWGSRWREFTSKMEGEFTGRPRW